MSGASKPAEPRGGALIVAAAVVLFVSCLMTVSLVPLFDPDEGYYPATAYESVAAGSLWDPRLDDAPRWDKPVLTYLLIEGSFALFGPSAAAARLPSVLQGAALVAIAGFVVSGMAGSSAGWLAAAVLASTLGLQIFARAAHPEMGVVLSIVTTELLACRWIATPDDSRRKRLAILAAASMGYGVLSKGPVAVLLPSLMLAGALPFLWNLRPTLARLIRDAAIALAGAIVIAAPWYIVMTLSHGAAFLYESLWRHNVVRYATGAFGHAGSPLFFVVPTLVGLLPWTGFLPFAFQRAREAETSARWTLRICLISSVATAFLFYSFSGSKLPNYALVLVPPLAILIALRIEHLLSPVATRPSASERLAAIVVFVIGAALVGIPIAVERGVNARIVLGGAPSRTGEVGAMLWRAALPPALALFAAGAVVLAARTPRSRLWALMTVGLIAPTLVFFGAAPLLNNAYPWERFGDRIRPHQGSVWIYRYRAPSLTFYARRPVHDIERPEQLDAIFRAPANDWVVLDRTSWDALRAKTDRGTLVDFAGRMVLIRAGGIR